MTVDQMVSLIIKTFIVQAKTREEYDAIFKTTKGGLTHKKIDSIDGRYNMYCATFQHVGIFNMKDHNYIWIHDKITDSYYEYRAWSFRKFKRAMKIAIANAKAGL